MLQQPLPHMSLATAVVKHIRSVAKLLLTDLRLGVNMDLGLLQRVESVCVLVVVLQPSGLVGWICDQAVKLFSTLHPAAVMKVLGISIKSFLHLTDLTDLSKILKIHRAYSHRACPHKPPPHSMAI